MKKCVHRVPVDIEFFLLWQSRKIIKVLLHKLLLETNVLAYFSSDV